MRKNIFILLALLMIVLSVGCDRLPEFIPEGSTPILSLTDATASQTPMASPYVLPSPTIKPTLMPLIKPIPSPTIEPSPTPKPQPAPTEYVFKPDTDIPDIIEGDSRNLRNNFYEDDEYLYYLNIKDDLDYLDVFSLCSINKTTGEKARLFDYCSSFCVEGDYIYWTELNKNLYQINKYDIKTKENTTICSTEHSSYSIQADNGRLYYTMLRVDGLSESDLYLMDIDGGNNEKLIENVVRYFTICNHNIFYMPFGTVYGASICMYDIDSKNTTELVGKCNRFRPFSVAYGKIFFQDYDDNDGQFIASINIVSGEKKMFKDANYGDKFVVSGQYLFYLHMWNSEYDYDVALRAYDIINDEYYDIYLYNGSLYFDASNKNLYIYDLYLRLKLIKISGGKASLEEVEGLNW